MMAESLVQILRRKIKEEKFRQELILVLRDNVKEAMDKSFKLGTIHDFKGSEEQYQKIRDIYLKDFELGIRDLFSAIFDEFFVPSEDMLNRFELMDIDDG